MSRNDYNTWSLFGVVVAFFVAAVPCAFLGSAVGQFWKAPLEGALYCGITSGVAAGTGTFLGMRKPTHKVVALAVANALIYGALFGVAGAILVGAISGTWLSWPFLIALFSIAGAYYGTAFGKLRLFAKYIPDHFDELSYHLNGSTEGRYYKSILGTITKCYLEHEKPVERIRFLTNIGPEATHSLIAILHNHKHDSTRKEAVDVLAKHYSRLDYRKYRSQIRKALVAAQSDISGDVALYAKSALEKINLHDSRGQQT